jgi:hypothetical protein
MYTSVLLAQNTDIIFPTTCKDLIFVDEICLNCAEDYCFGGALFLERYLSSRLHLLLKKEKLTTSEIAIEIEIDTLGMKKSMKFIAKDIFYESCSEAIFQAISELKRWKPDCSFSFDISENRMICREKKLMLYVRIIGGSILINGKRQRASVSRHR